MKSRSNTAGVLSLVCGVLGILSMVSLLLVALLVQMIPTDELQTDGAMPQDVFVILAAFYGVVGVVVGLIGVLGIVGGVFAMKKKHWGWALAGAIAGTFTFYPCGIAAVVLVSLGKSEFSPNQPVIVSTPQTSPIILPPPPLSPPPA